MKPTAPFKRIDRISEMIKQELASLLLMEVKDPRVKQVNITRVTITRDLGIAKIYYLVFGVDDAESAGSRRARREAEAGLDRATGFLRRELGKRIGLRTTPRLDFYWDDAVVHGRRMDDLFAELAEERERPSDETGSEDGSAEGSP